MNSTEMKLVSRFDNSLTPGLFTPWSIIHFFSGVGWALATQKFRLDKKWSFVFFMICNVIYEIKDAFFTNGQNSWQNSIADIVSGVAGYATAYKLSFEQLVPLCVIMYAIFTSPFSAKDRKTWSFWTDSWYTRD